MELFSTKIKKILTFSTKKAFLIFSQRKAFLILPELEPCIFNFQPHPLPPPKKPPKKSNPKKFLLFPKIDLSSPNIKKKQPCTFQPKLKK